MGDRGRDAEGGAGGVATGETGPENARRAKHADAPNVVPFPGDWIGPLDELVPIDLDPLSEDGATASDFWDGDTAVHEAVGSAGVRAGSAGVRVGSGAASQHTQLGVEASWPRYKRRGPTWRSIAAGLLALLVAGSLGLLFALDSGSAGSGVQQTVAVTRQTTARTGGTHGSVAHKAPAPKTKRLSVREHPTVKEGTSVTKPSSVTRTVSVPVTVVTRVPVTPTRVRQKVYVTPTTTPSPTVVQHVVTTPPKAAVTSHPTHSAPCALSPDSGCLP